MFISDFVDTFSVESNSLSGSVPSHLGMLTKLSASFLLNDNKLVGLGQLALPTQLGRLSEMKSHFMVNKNSLQGGLPAQLSSLSKMTAHFAVSDNAELCEVIPPGVAALSSQVRLRG